MDLRQNKLPDCLDKIGNAYVTGQPADRVMATNTCSRVDKDLENDISLDDVAEQVFVFHLIIEVPADRNACSVVMGVACSLTVTSRADGRKYSSTIPIRKPALGSMRVIIITPLPTSLDYGMQEIRKRHRFWLLPFVLIHFVMLKRIAPHHLLYGPLLDDGIRILRALPSHLDLTVV